MPFDKRENGSARKAAQLPPDAPSAASPLVSIVMPVYNVQDYLSETMATIFNQTFGDWELIVVDDGSEDQTPQILRRLIVQDSRIRVVRQQNAGIVVALNRGIQESRGLFIARADGDDLYHPDRLKLQTAYLQQHPEVVMVCCDYYLTHPHRERRLIQVPPSPLEIRRQLMIRNIIMHSSVMIRRSALLEAGCYQEKWRDIEDYELWFRMARLGPIASINLPLAEYRINTGSLSYAKEMLQVRRSLGLRASLVAKREVPLRWVPLLLHHFVKIIAPASAGRLLRSRSSTR